MATISFTPQDILLGNFNPTTRTSWEKIMSDSISDSTGLNRTAVKGVPSQLQGFNVPTTKHNPEGFFWDDGEYHPGKMG